MARISFDNAEQMTMQAKLQAALSRINKKKETTDSEEVVSVKESFKSDLNYDADYILNVLKESVGNAEKLVFLYLCLIAKDGKATTSQAEIASATRLGRTCVSYSLNALYSAGWIDCKRVRSGKTWANSYMIVKHFRRSEWQNTDFDESKFESPNDECSEFENIKTERPNGEQNSKFDSMDIDDSKIECSKIISNKKQTAEVL